MSIFRQRFLIKAVPALLLLVRPAPASAAEALRDFRGRVLPSVVCRADSSQSYAIYVPSRYTPEKKWPVIFCFDPGARGLVPVERLRAAAEQYGYIVAGSLTSRNGPVAANFAAMDAMANDVQSHLAADPRRIYAAGLSGGARVATQMALGGLAKGVIACSAGFPDPADIPRRVPFAFFGTTGTEDFNYREMKRLDADLADRKAAHCLTVFAGGHEWAPAPLLSAAVEWLELQAMRAGTRPRDEALVQAAFQAHAAALPASPAPERWLALRALVEDLQGLVDVGAYEREARELAGSPAVKAWQKNELALGRQEDAQRSRLDELVSGGSFGDRQKFAAGLRQAAAAAADTPERRMARRTIAGFAMGSREALRALFDQREYGDAAARLELQSVLRPGEARTYYDLARARAFDGAKARALEALKQAVAAGYRDGARAETEPAFAKLTGDPAFRELVAAMRNSPGGQPEAGLGSGSEK
ncbi:MAG TPA: hypothetical protein VG838_12390 [Opitutaceae bacterium]|nr:hypothetical protein [Opitutaceae bacterium]